ASPAILGPAGPTASGTTGTGRVVGEHASRVVSAQRHDRRQRIVFANQIRDGTRDELLLQLIVGHARRVACAILQPGRPLIVRGAVAAVGEGAKPGRAVGAVCWPSPVEIRVAGGATLREAQETSGNRREETVHNGETE